MYRVLIVEDTPAEADALRLRVMLSLAMIPGKRFVMFSISIA